MSRYRGTESTEADGWNQVRDYCNRFGRDRIHQYLIPVDRVIPSLSPPSSRPSRADNYAPQAGSEPRSMDANSSFKESSPEYDEHQNSITPSNKGGSPESIITSRKLEWDSMADIGYGQEKQNSNRPLSTIERIALERHYKNEITVNLTAPNAQSTPNELSARSQETAASPNVKITRPASQPTKRPKKKTTPLELKEPSTPKKADDSLLDTKETQTSNHNLQSDDQICQMDEFDIQCKWKIPKMYAKSPSNVSKSMRKTTFKVKRRAPKFHINFSSNKSSSKTEKQTKKLEEENEQLNDDEIISEKSISAPASTSVRFDEDEIISFDKSTPVAESLSVRFEDDLSKADSFEFMPGYLIDDKNQNSPLEPYISSSDKSEPASSKLPDNISSDRSNVSLSIKSPSSQGCEWNSKDDIINQLIKLKHSDCNWEHPKLINKIIEILESNSDFKNYARPQVENKSSLERISPKYVPLPVANLKINYIDNKATSSPKLVPLPVANVEINENDNKATGATELFHQEDKGINTDSIKKKDSTCSPIIKENTPIQSGRSDPKDYSILSNNSKETISKLNSINREISNLLLLKMKLENEKSQNRSEKNSNSDDKKTKKINSSDSSSLIKSTLPDGASLITDSEKTSVKCIPDLDIPLLNLKSSSDDSSGHNDKNANTGSKPCSLSNIELNSESKDETPKSVNTARMLCKCHPEEGNRICKHCGINTVSSTSQSFDSDSSLISLKLQRLRKIYNRYKNCKNMKIFLKDYEELLQDHIRRKELKVKPNILEAESITSENLNLISKSTLSSSTSNSNKSTNGKYTIRHKNIDHPISDENVKKASNRISLSSGSLQNNDKDSSKLDKASNSCSKKSDLQKEFIIAKNTSEESKTLINKESVSLASENVFKEDIPTSSVSLQVPCASKSVTSSYVESSISKKSSTSKEVLFDVKSKTSSYKESSQSKKSNDNIKSPSLSKIENSLLREVYSMMKKFDNHLNILDHISQMKMDESTQMPSSETFKTNSELHDSKNVESDRSSSKFKKMVKSSSTVRNSNHKSEKPPCKCSGKISKDENKFQSPKNSTNILPNKPSNSLPNPVAYNLILKPSDSILNDTPIEQNRRSLEDVIIKVPQRGKYGGFKVEHEISHHLHVALAPAKHKPEEIGYSTDEQLKEFSSLTDDRLNEVEGLAPKEKTLTLREYLIKNKPKFICNMEERQDILKNYNVMRSNHEKKRRIALEARLANISNDKNLSESKFNDLLTANGHPYQLQAKNALFDPHEVVKRTTKQYKKLPEVVNKKILAKKQVNRRTNRLMADIFVKKLRQKTLKGIVNISYNSKIISL